jgi:hypothetical protein
MSAWYIEQFSAQVGENVQADLAFAVLGGYLEAAEACKTRFSMFGWEKAIGLNRWFHIEEALLRLRLDHDVLNTVQLPNVSNSHHFGLVRSDSVYFTVAKVARPDAKPPRAMFRSALQSPVQLSWLGGWEALPRGGLCALLIHGPYADDQSRPAFLRIKFMDGNDRYLPEEIDLHRKFLSDLIDVKRVQIPKKQLVRARTVAKKQAN